MWEHEFQVQAINLVQKSPRDQSLAGSQGGIWLQIKQLNMQ